jgi:hypothetical protein
MEGEIEMVREPGVVGHTVITTTWEASVMDHSSKLLAPSKNARQDPVQKKLTKKKKRKAMAR